MEMVMALPHFTSPVSYQRGRGFGSLLRGIIRKVQPILRKPIVKQGIKSLGKATLEAAQKALESENIGQFGPSFRRAAEKNVKELFPKRKRISTKSAPAKRGRVAFATKRDIFSK